MKPQQTGASLFACNYAYSVFVIRLETRGKKREFCDFSKFFDIILCTVSVINKTSETKWFLCHQLFKCFSKSLFQNDRK